MVIYNIMTSYINNYNSTTIALADTEVFEGSASDVNRFHGVQITCITDQNGLLTIEWSNDLTNWDFVKEHQVLGGVAFDCTEQNLGRYVKVSLENNSGSNQTFLRLHTRFLNDLPDKTPQPYVSSILWDNVAVEDDESSPSIDLLTTEGRVDFLGSASSSGTINIELSHDNTNFIKSSNSLTVVPGDFHGSLITSCRYLRCTLDGSTNTLTLIASAK